MTEEDYVAVAEELEVLSDNVPGAFLYRLCLFVAVFNKHRCNKKKKSGHKTEVAKNVA